MGKDACVPLLEQQVKQATQILGRLAVCQPAANYRYFRFVIIRVGPGVCTPGVMPAQNLGELPREPFHAQIEFPPLRHSFFCPRYSLIHKASPDREYRQAGLCTYSITPSGYRKQERGGPSRPTALGQVRQKPVFCEFSRNSWWREKTGFCYARIRQEPPCKRMALWS